MAYPEEKPVKHRLFRFTKASRRAFAALPGEVQVKFLFALYQAELGGKHLDAKILHSFRGASVLEVVVNHKRATYPALYPLQFSGFVYLTHAFQKKSKSGSKTPKYELDAIDHKIAAAGKDHEQRFPNERPAAEGQG